MAAQIPLASPRVTNRHPPRCAHVSLHSRLPRATRLGSARLSFAPSRRAPRLAPNLSLSENSQSHGCRHMATIPDPDSCDNLPEPLSLVPFLLLLLRPRPILPSLLRFFFFFYARSSAFFCFFLFLVPYESVRVNPPCLLINVTQVDDA